MIYVRKLWIKIVYCYLIFLFVHSSILHVTSERNLWHVHTCHAYCSLLVFTQFNTPGHLKTERKQTGGRESTKKKGEEKGKNEKHPISGLR
jgi:hypothetical protein